MPNNSKHHVSGKTRRVVTLLTALTFLVLAVSGVIAFILPFSLGVIGLHALMGFAFIAIIVLHAHNNKPQLFSYVQTKTFWLALLIISVLTVLFWSQPGPIKTVLSWSGNLGPAQERFDIGKDQMVFTYSPSPYYKMQLNVKMGPAYREDSPPIVAIWLENQDGYHIKSLLIPAADNAQQLPYWLFKRSGWEKAKREAEEKAEKEQDIDAVSSPTPNASFDPADYILPGDAKGSLPYHLLLEIKQAGDEKPSLVYAVEIDNNLPKTFQLLDLRGYPKRDSNDASEKETWALYYIDESFTKALDLFDSALLSIERN